LTITKQGYRGWDVHVQDGGASRGFTVEDIKALCGFPAAFVLKGNYEDQWGLSGNAVMSPMMRRIADRVRETLRGATC
jgi:site-specific DNA-cytosine methylase